MTDARRNLFEMLRQPSLDCSDRVFLDLEGGRTLTFGELDDLSARIATVLRDSGCAPGDRLVVQAPKSYTALAVYLAALRIGAVYVPLNDAYTPDELAYFIEDAQPTVVVLVPGRSLPNGSQAVMLTLGADGLGSLADRAATATPMSEIVPRWDDPVAMLYTSGTTGKPKGAMLTAGNLASNAEALVRIWGFTERDVTVHALPIFHVHGLFIAIHCALLSASRVRFLPKFEGSAVRGALPGATVMMGVPTFYSRLLADPEFTEAACSTMRLFVSGSAPLTETVHRAFAERTGHQILERYGMTETGMITSNPLEGERIAGTVGFALPDVRVRVVDDAGHEQPTGEIGVVEVTGPNVFVGYRGMPEKTAAAFRDDGWFVTGDLGALSSDGRLTLSGRGTDLIISGGLNIYPKEIELVVDDVDGVGESAVIGVPHPDLGDAVVAIVVAEAGHEPADLVAAIGAGLDARLARFKHPKHIAVVAELPRNAMGKVEKAALRRTYDSLFT